LGATHPTIYKLVSALKTQQALTELKIEQFKGDNLPPPEKKYRELATKLKGIVERLVAGDFSPMEFIRAVAHQLSP
jgi:hypothetical protein